MERGADRGALRAVKPHPRASKRSGARLTAIPAALCDAPCIVRQGQLSRQRPAWSHQGGLFVDLFGGAGGVARRVCLRGCNSIVLDLDYGFDILNPAHFAGVICLARSGKLKGVMIAQPCESFSKARRAPQWSRMPHQLRSAEFVMGLPGLTGNDLKAVQRGNDILAAVICLVRILIQLHIPFAIENPRSSYLWETPSIKNLIARRDVICIDCHQCQFGCAWMKPTKFLLSEGMAGPHLSKTCVQVKGKCSRTHDKHFVLSGFGEDGAWRTTQAKVYSPQLCAAVVNTFCDHWLQEHIGISCKAASSRP